MVPTGVAIEVPAGVFEALIRLEQRLLADHAEPRTSCTWLLASVMSQCRLISCA